jgi:TonB family protein
MMTAFWLGNLLFYSLQLLLIVLACGALVWIVRLRDPRTELFYLQGVLAICLLLPVFQTWRTPAPGPARAAPLAIAAGESSPGQETAESAALSPFHAIAWLLVAGAGLRFAWIGVGFLRLARYRDKSETLSEPLAFAAVLQQRLGTNAALRISREARGPVTFGWLKPVVLLPERFLGFEPELQEAVLCHELLHVQRRDWLFAVGEECIRALLWFHPAVWWLIGRIHLVREQVVDREAIRLTDSRDPYLRALLAVAGHHLQPDLAPASLFLRKHHLDQRVAAVVRKEIPMSRIRSIAWLSLMSGAVVAAVWLAGSAFPLQAVPQATESIDPRAGGPRVVVQGKDFRLHALTGVVEQGGEHLLHEPHVLYSPEALDNRVEGRVVLELSVDKDGQVYDALVISGPQQLRRPALMSVLHWRYSPAIPLPTKLAVTIRFDLPPHTAQMLPADGAKAAGAASDSGAQPKRIRLGGEVQRARLLRQVRPEYPALAKQAQVEGMVVLNVSISPAGDVEEIDVESGHELLIPAAVNAVKQWGYRPVLLNGVPVAVETEVKVTFTLGESAL